jgi:hypothetical protein
LDVELIEARFGGYCREDAVFAVTFCSNTNALHLGDCCTWLERLFELEKGFFVCLMFRRQDGFGQ